MKVTSFRAILTSKKIIKEPRQSVQSVVQLRRTEVELVVHSFLAKCEKAGKKGQKKVLYSMTKAIYNIFEKLKYYN